MNRKLVLYTLAAFLLPLVVRFAWFFPGFNFPHAVATPDYANLKLPQAPVSTPHTEEVKQKGGTVLVDYSHSNQFQANEIQALVDALNRRGAHVDLNSDASRLESQLRAASAYVIISPSVSFSADEMVLIRDFVDRGGRMAVFTDATRGLLLYDFFGNPVVNAPDVNVVNPLLEPFDITVNADYLYNLVENEGNFRNVYFGSFGKSDLTWGLTKVALYGAHSMESDSGLALLVGDGKTFSSTTDAAPGPDTKQPGWAAAILSKDGNVLAIGDFTFLSGPYSTVGDNATLITDIADFLLSGKRKVALADYPFVFNDSTVSVLPTSDVQMTAEMIGALSRLQFSFRSINRQIKIADEAPTDGDLLVLGTFSPSDDLDKYVKSYKLGLDGFSSYIEVPGFGKLGRSGNGLLLFNTGKAGNTLVLLADSVDDLTTLMDTLSGGDLTDCVIQGDVGACSIGFGGSFFESTPEPEAQPGEATPTPAG
jgi:hypothetical protein